MFRTSGRFLLAALFLMMTAAQGRAAVISSAPFEHGSRSAWAEVIESESGAVTKSGSWTNFNFGADPWNQGTWLVTAGSYAEAVFSVAANTLLVQFEADGNDGVADFIVDGSSVGTYDTYNLGWIQVMISGLSNSAHTLRVVAGPHPGTTFPADDLAIDAFGAVVAAPPLAEPGTLALFGFGVLVLGYARRKKII